MAERLVAIAIETGMQVHEGDIVTDMHHRTAKFISATRADGEGRSGKVLVKFRDNEGSREYYSSVWGLIVRSLSVEEPDGSQR